MNCSWSMKKTAKELAKNNNNINNNNQGYLCRLAFEKELCSVYSINICGMI